MRMILGLDRPDAGLARVGGRRYRELRWPLREAGSLLEARAFHPGS
jgi:ABC-2 type transport system ATP-binding protein